MIYMGFPGGSNSKELACQCRTHKRCRLILLVRKIPWRRAWQPTPVFLPEESHGQKNLAGYSPWGPKETRLRDCIYMCLYTHTHTICVYARLSKLHMYICMLSFSCVCVYIYICNGSYKKNEIMPFTATRMQLEIIILSEVSQKEKDKYHTNHLYVESKI